MSRKTTQKTLTVNNVEIPVREDGMMSATAMCKANNKRFNDYSVRKATKALIAKLAQTHGGKDNVMQSNSGDGSWVCQELACDLAAWISDDYRAVLSKVTADALTQKVSHKEIVDEQPLKKHKSGTIEKFLELRPTIPLITESAPSVQEVIQKVSPVIKQIQYPISGWTPELLQRREESDNKRLEFENKRMELELEKEKLSFEQQKCLMDELRRKRPDALEESYLKEQLYAIPRRKYFPTLNIKVPTEMRDKLITSGDEDETQLDH